MGTNFIPDGFADFCFKKSFIPKLQFFYFIDVCGNGYLWNIVTTSLFMTLVNSTKQVNACNKLNPNLALIRLANRRVLAFPFFVVVVNVKAVKAFSTLLARKIGWQGHLTNCWRALISLVFRLYWSMLVVLYYLLIFVITKINLMIWAWFFLWF